MARENAPPLTPSSTGAHRFGLLKTVVFSVILIVLFFGAAETVVRFWVYFLREPAERFDLATGTFVLLPGRHSRLGAGTVTVNSRGFVGEEFEDPPPPGVMRIVAVGDSCTFGGGTSLTTYPGQLELRLNENEKRRFQVINAGIEGLNSELALRRLVTKVLPLKPDVITIYIGWNDLMKFDPAEQRATPGLAVIARLLDRLWLTKALRKFVFYYVRPHVYTPATGPASRTGAFRDYRPAMFEETLRTLVETARRSGARVLVMTLPSVVSSNMTPEELRRANVVFPYFRSAYAVGDFVDLIAAYNESIRRIASEHDVVMVDLASEINARGDRRALFFDTMHPNQLGKELIAQILKRELQENRIAAR